MPDPTSVSLSASLPVSGAPDRREVGPLWTSLRPLVTHWVVTLFVVLPEHHQWCFFRTGGESTRDHSRS